MTFNKEEQQRVIYPSIPYPCHSPPWVGRHLQPPSRVTARLPRRRGMYNQARQGVTLAGQRGHSRTARPDYTRESRRNNALSCLLDFVSGA